MKILHIASIGRIYEGIGTVINHLYQEQINLGHDVRIISKRQNLLYTNSVSYTHLRAHETL